MSGFHWGSWTCCQPEREQLPAAADQGQEGAPETHQEQVATGRTQGLLCSLWKSCLGTFGHTWPELWSLTGWGVHDRDKTQTLEKPIKQTQEKTK